MNGDRTTKLVNEIECLYNSTFNEIQYDPDQAFAELWKERQDQFLPRALELIQLRWKSSQPLNELPYCKPQGERVLLLMAGYSAEQLALCIAMHVSLGNVSRIVTFTSPSTWNTTGSEVDLALQKLGMSPQIELACGEFDTSEPALVFQRVAQWWRDNRDSDLSIAIDVTGGQKPMDSGATYAAMFYDWPAYYLDFTDYDTNRRRPFPQTLVYQRLQLPAGAFAHDRRKAIMDQFNRCRFGSAESNLRLLSEQAEERSKFFNDSDRADLLSARKLATQCRAWMNAQYSDQSLAAHPLHDRAVGKKGTREKLFQLRDCAIIGNQRFEWLRDYVLDEFWRLKTIHDELGDDAEGVRDVIVGSAALCEFIVDSCFSMPSVRIPIVGIRSPSTHPRRPTPLIQAPKSKNPIATEVYERIAEALEAMDVHPRRLPPGLTSSKMQLLRGHQADLFFWLDARAMPSLQDAAEWTDAKSLIETAMCSPHRVSGSQHKLVVTFAAKLSSGVFPPKYNVQKTLGGFGDSTSRWIESRNLVAHFRGMVDEEQIAVAGKAVNQYLPRFVGLLEELCALGDQADRLPVSSEQIEDRVEKLLKNGSRRPWYDRQRDLRDWLQLPTA